MDSPIVKATWQAAVLSAISNLLAQMLASWRKGALSISLVDTFHFVLFAALSCPPNVVWQAWLEASYPAYGGTLPAREREALVDEAVTAHTTAAEKEQEQADAKRRRTAAMTQESSASMAGNPAKKLNKKNTAIKFALDQTLGAVVNTLLFIAGIGLIRGKTTAAIQRDVYTQFIPMMAAGLKLWPLVSIMNFTLVPLEYRMLVGNVAGLFWGIFLSLAAGSG